MNDWVWHCCVFALQCNNIPFRGTLSPPTGEGDWQLYVFILFFHFVCALRYVCMCGHSLIPSEGESLRELKQSSASLVRNPLIAQATRVHALSSLCFRHTLLLRSDPAVCVCSHGSCSLIGDTAYVLLLSPSPCTSQPVFMFTAVAQILLETESCGWDTHLELDVRHETQLSEHVTKSVSVLLLAKAGLPSSSVLSTLPLTLELFLLSLQKACCRSQSF